jgi:transcriptional regulator with PAS, ATPase and Fis domain
MDDQLMKKLLSQARDMFAHFQRYMLVHFNEKGEILEHWNSRSFKYGDIPELLIRSGNVLNHFDLSPYSILDDFPIGRLVRLKARPGKLELEYFSNYYFETPTGGLSVSRLNKNNFFGALSVDQWYPNILLSENQAMIYVNTPNDRLAGLNTTFFDYFKNDFENPKDLIGLPCSDLIQPTLQSIQSDYFKNLKTPQKESFHLTNNLLAELAGSHNHFTEGNLSIQDQSLAWDNSGRSEAAVITLEAFFNLHEEDLWIDFTFSMVQGTTPIVMLGQRKEKQKAPDQKGYTVGYNHTKRSAFLKKYGFVSAFKEAPLNSSGQIHYRLIKNEKAFYFFINGKEVLRHYDFEFIKTNTILISVGLRPESSITVKELLVRKRALESPLELQPMVVSLKNNPEEVFSLNPCYNFNLTANRWDIQSFVLPNISQLKKDVTRFQTLYEGQLEAHKKLKAVLTNMTAPRDLLIGQSKEMEDIRENVQALGDSNAEVIIEGETGTGKENLARFIHKNSPFKNGPFVKLDCSALAPSIIESELFGHEIGAFTGAVKKKVGKFEMAHNGTLFLDEVSNLNRDIQAKLLGFLDNYQVTRVGGSRSKRVNIRMIGASNIPFNQLVQEGVFRQDLLFRINTIKFTLPPLRKRSGDIAELASHFISVISPQYGKEIKGLSQSAFEKLSLYQWPGNIRELRNIIHRAVIFCKDSLIESENIITDQFDQPNAAGDKESGRYTTKQQSILPAETHNGNQSLKKKSMRNLPKNQLLEIIKENKGNINKIAQAMGQTRQAIYYQLKKFNIKIERFRGKPQG